MVDQSPLYPYFLAVIYTWFGQDFTIVAIVQGVVGSFSCVLLGAAGWRLISKRAGLVAGLMLGMCAPAIFADAAIQPSVLDLFFVCWFLWHVSGLVQNPTWRLSWLWSGFALGCLSLTQEVAWVFLVPMFGWVVLQHRDLGRQRLVLVAILLVGVMAAVAPSGVRNQIVSGDFRLIVSQLGPAFYIGNNAEADGTYRPLSSAGGGTVFERADAMALAEQLRDAMPGRGIQLHCGGGSFKSQMKKADRSGARYAVILGENEVANGTAGLKPLRADEPQAEIAQDKLADTLAAALAN